MRILTLILLLAPSIFAAFYIHIGHSDQLVKKNIQNFIELETLAPVPSLPLLSKDNSSMLENINKIYASAKFHTRKYSPSDLRSWCETRFLKTNTSIARNPLAPYKSIEECVAVCPPWTTSFAITHPCGGIIRVQVITTV